jgi:hypothetical protein
MRLPLLVRGDTARAVWRGSRCCLVSESGERLRAVDTAAKSGKRLGQVDSTARIRSACVMDAGEFRPGDPHEGAVEAPRSSGGDAVHYRLALADDKYSKLVEYYGEQSKASRRWYNSLVTVALIFSGTAPVLVISDDVPEAIRAAWTAVAAIALGINAQWKNQQNFVRSAVTLEVLKAERFLFETRTGPYLGKSDEVALDMFALKLKEEWLNETFVWKGQAAAAPDVGSSE